MSQIEMNSTENDRAKRRFTEYARMQMAGVAFFNHQLQVALVKDGVSWLHYGSCRAFRNNALERDRTTRAALC